MELGGAKRAEALSLDYESPVIATLDDLYEIAEYEGVLGPGRNQPRCACGGLMPLSSHISRQGESLVVRDSNNVNDGSRGTASPPLTAADHELWRLESPTGRSPP